MPSFWGTWTKLAHHATKCIFRGYGTHGEFNYRLWSSENWKLIRSSDVLFNEDSILSSHPSQPKRSGKKVSFDEDIVEGPTHQAELAIRQIVNIDQANPPAEFESAGGPLVEFDSTKGLT